MFLGILAGLATGALWSLSFIAPRIVAPFTAWDITVARYGLFGLICVLLMLHPRFQPRRLGWRRIAIGCALGGLGYVGYFICVAYAVRLAGTAIPPLIIGTMPVVLAVIANARDKTIPWRSLLLPLGLTASGILLVNLSTVGTIGVEDRTNLWLGIFFATMALAIWVIYGMANAAIMKMPDAPDGLRWTGVQGLGAGLVGLALAPFTSFTSATQFWDADGSRFLMWVLIMAIAASWLATFCWVFASRRLPLALSAQLVVAETVFGLLLGFTFEQRWPTQAEWLGCGLQCVGVVTAIAIFARSIRPRIVSS
ncbi:DMT family transporter [Phyllobacterium sp. 628]|uniref:DMT family transporter n=1 Tax=Phyllobacterium sp. 628 TaxID=2718938 RepID=UPI00166262A0|nr:DMT family transporter [Phyllobacterium sp. 628]QND51837.1 DMT family transporter [Phyllobacterium sp. 628]